MSRFSPRMMKPTLVPSKDPKVQRRQLHAMIHRGSVQLLQQWVSFYGEKLSSAELLGLLIKPFRMDMDERIKSARKDGLPALCRVVAMGSYPKYEKVAGLLPRFNDADIKRLLNAVIGRHESFVACAVSLDERVSKDVSRIVFDVYKLAKTNGVNASLLHNKFCDLAGLEKHRENIERASPVASLRSTSF